MEHPGVDRDADRLEGTLVADAAVADLGELVAGLKPGRVDDKERTLAINLGEPAERSRDPVGADPPRSFASGARAATCFSKASRALRSSCRALSPAGPSGSSGFGGSAGG